MNNEKYRLVFPSMAITRKAYLVFKFFIFHFSFNFRLQSYNILIAVHESFVNFFQNFFEALHLLQCCSVAVLENHFPYKKILLYLYINIEFNFDFHII